MSKKHSYIHHDPRTRYIASSFYLVFLTHIAVIHLPWTTRAPLPLSFSNSFSLSTIPYHVKEYPTTVLFAIMEESLFSETYTWVSKHNTSSKKQKLPKVMQDAIMHVGRAAIRGIPGVTEKQLERAFMNRFSSYAARKRKNDKKNKKVYF